MLIRITQTHDVYEVVGSHLEHVTKEAFDARGLTQANVKVLRADHPLFKLPKK